LTDFIAKALEAKTESDRYLVMYSITKHLTEGNPITDDILEAVEVLLDIREISDPMDKALFIEDIESSE
jgi:hypothetical protein